MLIDFITKKFSYGINRIIKSRTAQRFQSISIFFFGHKSCMQIEYLYQTKGNVHHSPPHIYMHTQEKKSTFQFHCETHCNWRHKNSKRRDKKKTENRKIIIEAEIVKSKFNDFIWSASLRFHFYLIVYMNTNDPMNEISRSTMNKQVKKIKQ